MKPQFIYLGIQDCSCLQSTPSSLFSKLPYLLVTAESLFKTFPPDISLSVHTCTHTHINTRLHSHKCINAPTAHTIPAEPHVHKHSKTSLHTHSLKHKHTSYTQKCLYTYTLHTHTSVYIQPCTNICPYTGTNSTPMHTPINNPRPHIYLHAHTPYTHMHNPDLNMDEKWKNLGLHFII